MKRPHSFLEHLSHLTTRADTPELASLDTQWQQLNAELAKSTPELAGLWARLAAVGGRAIVGEPEPWLDVLRARGVVMVRTGARIIKRTAPDRYISAVETWSDFFPEMPLVVGYALDADGVWRRRAWCRYVESIISFSDGSREDPRGQLIECEPIRLAYFGATLDEDEALTFALEAKHANRSRRVARLRLPHQGSMSRPGIPSP